ncbi:MAG: acetate--CoA ligase family protein [Pseudomonadota bacterium]
MTLDALFRPNSVALIGASTREGSYGRSLFDMATGGGFTGRIYPVNPTYSDFKGHRFYPAISEIPEQCDLAVLSVATDRVVEAVEAAIAARVRALAIFAQVPDHAMRDRIADIVEKAGIPVCGPNSMGFHNIPAGLRITPFPAPLNLTPGGIAIIAQSGSIMGALAHNDRRLRFSQIVSTGSETVTTAADFLAWILQQETTRVVGMFLETVRDPARFVACLEDAAEKDIPIVILKVGRTEASARMAVSHTGALVGNHDVFEATAKRYGAHLVETVDEMAAVLMLFSTGRRIPQEGRTERSGIASIHDSGGERELIADLATDLNIPFAKLSDDTLKEIADHLEPGLEADNPLDAWGVGLNAIESFLGASNAMMADSDVLAGLYVLNWRDHYYLHEIHERVLCDAVSATDKPLVAVTNYSMTTDAVLAERFAERGIPLIKGMREALVALRALLDHKKPAPRPDTDTGSRKASHWRARLKTHQWTGEAEGYELLSAFGVDCVRHELVSSADQAIEAAERLGYPVVLKTAEPGVLHKSDEGGVKINLKDQNAVALIYQDLEARFGSSVLVAEMVDAHAEWALGVIFDPDFGPAIMISPGGVLVELFEERVVMMAPFSAEDAAAAINSLKAARLLKGFRGTPPLHGKGLADTASALSQIAWIFQDDLDELEINPVLVGISRAVAVDVLLQTGRTDSGHQG